MIADEDLLKLDPTCPLCLRDHDIGEVFDGSERWCRQCRVPLVAVEYEDGTMRMERVKQLVDETTGRQRTRALWRKRGRR